MNFGSSQMESDELVLAMAPPQMKGLILIPYLIKLIY